MTEPPAYDPDHLAARLRRGDAVALAEAYWRLFSGEIGRFVLADILVQGGVGATRPEAMGGEARAFHDGRAGLALEISNRAKFDQFAVAVTAMGDDTIMRGRDERDSDHGDGGDGRDDHGFSGPDRSPRFVDDD